MRSSSFICANVIYNNETNLGRPIKKPIKKKDKLFEPDPSGPSAREC